MRAFQKLFVYTAVASMAALFTSCGTDSQSTGLEYAPQMYHSIPYEPYSQVTDTSNEYFNTNTMNATASNQRKPVKGSIQRKMLSGVARNVLAKDIMVYNIPADSIDYASAVLKNPLDKTSEVLEEGKALYNQYCVACHGANGQGNGKVADLYKGVPNYSVGRYATLTEGHIFHVITYGKGRMWPHGSQVNPQDRWKIVRFVQTLQKPV